MLLQTTMILSAEIGAYFCLYTMYINSTLCFPFLYRINYINRKEKSYEYNIEKNTISIIGNMYVTFFGSVKCYRIF